MTFFVTPTQEDLRVGSFFAIREDSSCVGVTKNDHGVYKKYKSLSNFYKKRHVTHKAVYRNFRILLDHWQRSGTSTQFSENDAGRTDSVHE